MGLDIGFDIKEKPNGEIWIYDITGIYHSVNNPTGWGGANPALGTVLSAELEVTRPDPTTLQLSEDDTFRTLLSASPAIPNLTGDRYTVTPSDLGTTELIDGRYRFKFTISGTASAVPYELIYQIEKVFYNNLFCCAVKKQSEAKLENCGCTECIDKLFSMNMLMCAVDEVISANACGKPNQALDSLKVAQKLCDDDCSDC